MSEFEDNLWLEVVREHGNEPACAGRTVRKQRRATSPQLLAGSTVGLVAIATAAALLLGASTGAPAFAVTRNDDGTVTVNLMKPSGIAGANGTLAAMGVRAQIAVPAKTPPKLVCPGGTAPTIRFDPASIPGRQVLLITPGQPNAADAAVLKAHKADNNGSGNTRPGAILSDSNHVVRMLSGGGKIGMPSGANNHVIWMHCP